MIRYLSRAGSTAMVLVVALTAPAAAQVDLGATRGKSTVSPRSGSILSPMAIDCLVLSDGGRAEIHVRNSTDQTLQADRRVRWKASNGDQGLGGISRTLPPGATAQVDRSHHSTSCSATLLRPDPVFSQ